MPYIHYRYAPNLLVRVAELTGTNVHHLLDRDALVRELHVEHVCEGDRAGIGMEGDTDSPNL